MIRTLLDAHDLPAPAPRSVDGPAPVDARRWLARIRGVPLLAALLVASATPAASRAAAFWDRYEAARDLPAQYPERAIALAESLIRADPQHVLGHWLRGAALASSDSARALEAVHGADAWRDQPGLQIEAGTILLQWKRTVPGREAFDRARDLFLASGDSVNAARAQFWKMARGADQVERAKLESDVAGTEALARGCGDPATVAAVLIFKGERAMRRDLQAALPAFRAALELLVALPPGQQLLLCHRDLASALRSSGDYDGSESHYRGVLETARALSDSAQEVRALLGLASIRKAQGRYDEAWEFQRGGLEQAKRIGELRLLTIAYYDLGTLLWETAHYREAEENLRTSLACMDSSKWETDNRTNLLDALGGVETSLGEYEAARAHLERALALCRARNLKATGAFALLHLGNLHRELGEFETALRHVEEGLAMARDAGQKRVESVLLSLEARTLNDAGDYAGGLAAARAGGRLAREVEPRNRWRLDLYAATALAGLGRTREGIAVLESTLVFAPGMTDSAQLGYVLQVEGDLLLLDRQTERAVAVLERSLAISRFLENPRRIADLQLSLGPARLAAGRATEAVAALDEGLRWFESAQSSVRTSEERSGCQTHWHDSYFSLARAQLAAGHPAQAFATLERGRGRELRRLFALRSQALRTRVPAALSRRVEAVESDLTALQATLLHEYEQPAGGRAALAGLERRADSLKARWAELNRRVQLEAPAYAREAGLLPAISAGEVRRRLGASERLIAFMVGEDATLVFDFSRGRLRVHERAIGRDSIARRVESVTALMRSGNPENGAEQSAALADALLGACRLPEDPPQTLYLLPDEALHYLPFEALTLGPSTGGRRRYLIEWSAVAYANSATLLFHPPGSQPGRRGTPAMVAFGDPRVGKEPSAALRGVQGGVLPAPGPLPHARREVEALTSLYPGARVYVGDQATEGRFLAETARASVVHVAAHAFVDDRHPEFSGLLLAPSPSAAGTTATDDGLVQAFEIIGRHFDLDLATLSACESGSGALLRGEGLIGLSRAFRLAGARNLLVSLWKVDDAATADFMTLFYTRLARGEPAAAALRTTKLAFLRGEAPAAPSGSADDSPARGVGRIPRAQSQAAPSAWAPFMLLASHEP